MRKKRNSRTDEEVHSHHLSKLKTCNYGGESLTSFLEKIGREIESEKILRGALPEKIWMKQQFSIGVNDVTRVLEKMPRAQAGSSTREPLATSSSSKAPPVALQAVLLASDCRPNLLIKHIPSLASSRRVPVIIVRDRKEGSLRLGELMNIKTALAVGVKAKESGINKAIEEILNDGLMEVVSKSSII